MAEVSAPPITKCKACPRHFNELGDLCQVAGCGLCRGCHVSAYGREQPHAFNDENLVTPEIREQLTPRAAAKK